MSFVLPFFPLFLSSFCFFFLVPAFFGPDFSCLKKGNPIKHLTDICSYCTKYPKSFDFQKGGWIRCQPGVIV